MQQRSKPPHRLHATKSSQSFLKYYVLLAVLLLLGFMAWLALLKPLPIAGKGTVIVVKKGETFTGVIHDLSAQKKIMFPRVIIAYRHFFVTSSLKAGVYPIKAGTNIIKLFDILSQGKDAQMSKVTVIEGITFNSLRQQLAQNTNIKQTLTDLTDKQVLARITPDLSYAEGNFAPDTYFFNMGESDVSVLTHLYKQQQSILKTEWESRLTGLPYKSLDDALIMASIIEKETASPDDRARIAGVFVERLKVGMRLQTDPTVIYGMGSRYTGNLTRKDLETPTAYNTYTIDGLPPTPICLPSKAAINAALHPDMRGDLYFVASGIDDHSVFSKTLAEHNRAVAAYVARYKASIQQAQPATTAAQEE